MSSLPGTHNHGHVLLLWTCGAQWVWHLLQPPARKHPLLHLQLPRLQGDLFYQVCESCGRKPHWNERPLQSATVSHWWATVNKRKSKKTQPGPPTLTPTTRCHLPKSSILQLPDSANPCSRPSPQLSAAPCPRGPTHRPHLDFTQSWVSQGKCPAFMFSFWLSLLDSAHSFLEF